MEMLKALIPGEMRRRIYEGNADDLPSTCSSLIEFFRPLPQFQQVVRELSDPVLWMCGKDRESAAAMKEKGNVSFRNGDYPGALQSYTKKMGLFEESVRDCNRALLLFTCYGKAWYQRGRANLSLWNHSCAIKDMSLALKMEKSSAGKS